MREDIERKLEVLKEWWEEQEEEVWTVIGGDFNARTGNLGRGEGGEGEEEKGRRSKDKKINREGKRLAEEIEKVGWGILNGCTVGDEEGEFTYTGGRGETVIDYVMGEEKVRERVLRLEVGESIESDHHPLIVTLEGKGVKRARKRKYKVERKEGRWTERDGERIRERIRGIRRN